jgi:excisionase family DNA binding protein
MTTSTKLPLTLEQFQALLSQVAYDPDRVRSLDATAAYLSTTKGAVQALIKRGELKSLQIGNAHYVAQSAIHEWIEREHKRQERENYRREVMPVGVDPEVEKALKKK